MIHHFKVHPEPFIDISYGDKKHEIRRDDRPTRPRVGDMLVLREWDPREATYTGRDVHRRVTHVSLPGTWGLPADLYVMSIEPWPVRST